MSTGTLPLPRAAGAQRPGARRGGRRRSTAWVSRLTARPELLAVMALAALLDLWNLSLNGFANTYYAAAVRSMAASWHDFLYGAMDPSGLMTVDKPPLALWVQALSVRLFGYHSLSVLVPEALMGVLAVALLYDLVARRFGRLAGAVGALTLALTPVTVAMSRHNNPDELLALCSVAAVWCGVRAVERDSLRWLIAAAVAAGLGFETKMAAALLIVPGIGLAWLWCAPRGRRVRAAVRGLAAGGAGLAVALAWPLLVTLSPAAGRPWISGTSDNSVWSLIFGYNGVGRLAGQSGGPGGGVGGGGAGGGAGAGGLFGGSSGFLRLLNSALGGQDGWLLGLALFAAALLLARTRLRRSDPRTPWLLAVGGAFAVCAVAFSFAQGIFHPYYVAQLAPFAAALGGAGTAEMLRGGARWVAAAGLAAGAVSEVVVLGDVGGLSWATPLVVVLCGGCALALLFARVLPRLRVALVATGLAALLAAPAVWAADTLGHATSSTFPAGGPASAALGAPGRFGAPGRLGAFRRPGGFAPPGASGAFRPPAALAPAGAPGALGAPPGSFGPPPRGSAGFRGGPGGFRGGPGGGPGAPGGFGAGDRSLQRAIAYARNHGGGTIAVESQSSAAALIVARHADVAGIGGFSGRESSVSTAWLADELAAGRLRWLLVDAQPGGGLPGDTRAGSRGAFAAAAKVCRSVTLTGSSGATLLDCAGRSEALRTAGRVA